MVKHIEAENQPCLQGALSMGEVRFREALEGLPDAFILLSVVRDESGRVIDFCVDYANHLALEMVGPIREEYIGHRLLEVFPGICELGLFDIYVQVVETGKSFYRDSFIYKETIGGKEISVPIDIRVSKIGDGVAVIWRDVSARINVEKALKAERERWQGVVEGIADEVWVVDKQGNMSLINLKSVTPMGLEEFKDLPVEEVLKRVDIMYLDGRLRPPGESPLLRSLRGEIVRDEEIMRDRSTGKVRYRQFSSAPTRDAAGNITGAVAIVRDITELKQAEKALRESEETLQRYRLLSLHARDIILFVLPDGRIIEANDAATEAYGYSRDELLALSIYDLRAPETRDFANPQMEQADTKGILFETIHRRKDGSTFPVEVSSQGAEIDGERVLLSIIRDITERKKAEEALRESEAFSRKILTSSLNGLYIFDLEEQNIIFINDQYTRLTGYTLGDLNEMSQNDGFFQLFHSDDLSQVVNHAREMADIKDGETREIEYRYKIKDGSWRWMLSRETAFSRDPDGNLRQYIGSFLDITDRKQAEEALRETEHDLNRAQAIAHIGSWRMDVQHNVLLWSDETYRIFGVPKGTFLTYEAFLSAVHPDDREYVDQKWKAALHGKPYDIEHRITVGNTVKWVHETAELEFDRQKRLLGGFGTVQDITDRKRAEEKLARALVETEREKQRVTAMESIAETGISTFETHPLFNILAERIAEGMNTHSCTIFLLDEKTNEFEACAAHNIPEECGFRVKTTEGFIGKVTSTRRTVYIHDAQSDPLVTNPHIKREGARSLLGTPLIVRDKLIGAVYVDMLEIREFSREEIRLFELMATRAALIIDNARLRDEVLQSHETIQHQLTLLQRALLPPEAPAISPGYRVAAAYIPGAAGQEIGGDFYDIFETETGETAIFIGDVSGKGIESASLAAATRSTTRAFAYDISSAGGALTHANSVLHQQQPEYGSFVTVFLVLLNPQSGEIRYANAGHPPPAICRRKSGCVEFLNIGQMPIGLLKEQEFIEWKSYLEPGDKIVFYTDGITEARRNSEMFGEEKFEGVLKEHIHLAPDDLTNCLLSTASDWAHGQFKDDVAVIIVERQMDGVHQ